MAFSSSSSSCQEKHQVFLSFRGEDTRYNFTGHLLEALQNKGLNVFFDEKTMEKGEEISQELLKGIAASNISIIVLSVDYASSNSCLAELFEIMHRKCTEGHIVIPVFYKVEPSNVKHLGGSFKTSFEHKSKTKRPADEVKRWKKAFSEVGGLTGHHIKGDRYESECIKEIVKDVITKLDKKFGNGSGDFIGIDDQKKAILKLMEEEGTRVVGIWGMGGIGKTTLAEAVYKEVSPKFVGSSFLYNVRNKLEKKGMESLRNEFLSKLLEHEIRIDTPSTVPLIHQQMLNNKKVFVVLDDVNDWDQVNCLGVQYFGHGSKTLITSRDKQVLKKGGVDKIYGVKILNEADSLQLFFKHAFKQSEPVTDWWDLSQKFLKYSQGNPLALRVLGSSLYDEPREVWESELDKLNEYPELEILKVLKISFDGLGELEKNIFLDVACFFNGEEKTFVVEILRCCYKGAIRGIDTLVKRCLLDSNVDHDISHSGGFKLISMHNLLQEMGRDIARNEYKKDPEKCRRLCSAKDVYRVLKYNEGIESIEGIMSDMSQIDALQLCPTVFKKMTKLRVLKLYFSGSYERPSNKGLFASAVGSVFLPEELRYLRWDCFPFKSLSSNFNPKNLVELKLVHGNMEQLWNGDHQDLVNLKQIILDDCKNLRKFPNLSGAIKLEILKCYKCENLVELPCLQDLINLREIVFKNGKNLRKIHNLSRAIKLESLICYGCESLDEDLINLRKIKFKDCKNLRKIPNLPGAIKLEIFYCYRCESLVELPYLQDLINLKEIVLKDCKNLRKISNLSGAIKLEILRCYGCESLVEFPCLQDSNNLRKIILSGCKNLNTIPNLLGLINLESLNCDDCESLIELPSLKHLTSLRDLKLEGCHKLKNFPDVPSSISSLYLPKTGIEEVPSSIGCLNKLWWLDMRGSSIQNLRCNIDPPGCPETIDVPSSTSRFESLGDLNLNHCKSLKLLSELPPHLFYLDACDCTSLEKVSFADQYLNRDCTVKFSNCVKLSQDSIDNIVANAMLRIGSAAKLSSGNEYADIPEVFFCLPGNEIFTKKFEFQSTNSSIVLKIGQNSCSGSRSLAFALCLVVDFEHRPRDDIEFICEFQLKARGGDYEEFKSEWFWGRQHFEAVTEFLDDHVFILFSGDMVKKDKDYEEASFEFYVQTSYYDGEERRIKFDDFKVKKCGVHVFYVDAGSSVDGDVESREELSSDELGTDKSDENSGTHFECKENFDSEEDANIEEVHDDSATKMRPGHKRSFSYDGEGEGRPKSFKYFHFF